MLSSGEPLWPLLLKAPAVGVAEGKVTGIGQKASGELNLPKLPLLCCMSANNSNKSGVLPCRQAAILRFSNG